MIDAHDPTLNDPTSKAVGRAIFNAAEGDEFVIEFTRRSVNFSNICIKRIP
jgi:hypothetical protein